MSEVSGAAMTIGAALEHAGRDLAAAGVEHPRGDARLLLGGILDGGPGQVTGYPEQRLGAPELAAFEAAVRRRAAREPVSRILGRREFWSLEFAVTPATLDPRPDSETLIEAVLERIGDRTAPLRTLDLGCGTGCLLLALLSELPCAQGLGIDIDPAAVAASRANAERLSLADRARFEQGDWAARLSGPWQVIVSNPPYIMEDAIDGLAPEVAKFDPNLALSGGSDGLAAYRRLIPQAARILDQRGTLAVEVGIGQAGALEGLMTAAGLTLMGRKADLAGIDRCVLATRQAGKQSSGFG